MYFGVSASECSHIHQGKAGKCDRRYNKIRAILIWESGPIWFPNQKQMLQVPKCRTKTQMESKRQKRGIKMAAEKRKPKL
jgi:hypothetical protein